MRYRALDENGDMTFGQGGLNFLVNSPEAVGQAVLTRLLLRTGEWFLDVTEGTAYDTLILGFGTRRSRDVEIRNRILGTQGVTEIVTYSSSVDAARKFSVQGDVATVYGALDLSSITVAPDPAPSLDFRKPGNSMFIGGL